MHFDFSNSRVTSSEAVLATLPNIALADWKKDFLMHRHDQCKVKEKIHSDELFE